MTGAGLGYSHGGGEKWAELGETSHKGSQGRETLSKDQPLGPGGRGKPQPQGAFLAASYILTGSTDTPVHIQHNFVKESGGDLILLLRFCPTGLLLFQSLDHLESLSETISMWCPNNS